MNVDTNEMRELGRCISDPLATNSQEDGRLVLAAADRLDALEKELEEGIQIAIDLVETQAELAAALKSRDNMNLELAEWRAGKLTPWRSVAEEPPEDGADVLVTFHDPGVGIDEVTRFASWPHGSVRERRTGRLGCNARLYDFWQPFAPPPEGE